MVVVSGKQRVINYPIKKVYLITFSINVLINDKIYENLKKNF